MNKNTTLLAAALALATVVPAAADTKARVAFTDESRQPVEVALSSGSKMLFGQDAALTFSDVLSAPQPISLRDVSRITFSGSWSAVDKVADSRRSLSLAENPVGDVLRVEGYEGRRPTTLSVYSIAGREAVRINSWNGEDIDVSTLPRGVYLLRVDNTTIKFIKK